MADHSLPTLMDPGIPSRVAQRYVELMNTKGIHLQYNQQSFKVLFELDLAIEAEPPILFEVDGEPFELVTGATCFFGETLRREYSGVWHGQLNTYGAANYYTTGIKFGAYWFYPFLWIWYRQGYKRGDGKCLDIMLSRLSAVIPSIRDGIDYKKQTQ